MKAGVLYLFLLVGVLAWAGCETESPQSSNSTDPDAPTTDEQAEAPADATDPPDDAINVLVLGNSIAAGYGLDPDDAFPNVLGDKAEDAGFPLRVDNASESGLTTAGGLSRLDWVLREPVDIFILELGGNDGLRGIDPTTTQDNLEAMIETVTDHSPDVQILLGGMEAPPNMGLEYTSEFRGIYPDVAEQHDHVTLIPFILEDVAGNPDKNQPDGIHPTAEGQRIVAQNVWDHLKPMLEEADPETASATSP